MDTLPKRAASSSSSFQSLLSFCREFSVIDPNAIFSLQGFIARRRTLSRRLLFYDLVELQPEQETSVQDPCLELIAKPPDVCVEKIAEINRAVSLGDRVYAKGFPELTNKGIILFHVIELSVSQKHASWGNSRYSVLDSDTAKTVSSPSSSSSSPSSSSPSSSSPSSSSPSSCLLTDSHNNEAEERRRKIELEVEVFLKHLANGGAKNILSLPFTEIKSVENQNDYEGEDEKSDTTHFKQKFQKVVDVCIGWWRTQHCSRASCPRRHYFVDADEKSRYEHLEQRRLQSIAKEREAGKMLKTVAAEDTLGDHGHEENSGENDLGDKSTRAKVFVEWLRSTFGSQLERGILDIAGGRGCISFELHSRHHLPCTLIDPRPMRLTKSERRFLKDCKRKRNGEHKPAKQEMVKQQKREEPDPLCACSRDCISPFSFTSSSTTSSSSIPCFNSSSSSSFKSSKMFSIPSMSGISSESSLPHQLQCLFDDAFLPDASGVKNEKQQLLESSAVLVGMHSDQATEPIVDIALRTGKSFAVVPCCVFPHLFPDRRLADGRPVVEYSDFVQYLMSKDSDIRSHLLPFQGRNRVVYRVVSG